MDGVEKQMKTGWGAEDKREKEKDWERETGESEWQK